MTTQPQSATAPAVFQFNQSYQVRIVVIDSEPWFCLSDVCAVLDIKNASQTGKQLDQEGLYKTYTPPKDKAGITQNVTPSSGGAQEMIFISEPNLYRVIFRSNKPEAKTFQDWVFNDVLPAIRKTGKYVAKQYAPEYISNTQYHELKNLVWVIGRSFHRNGGGEFAAWRVLRKELGCEVAQKLPAEHFDAAKARLEQINKQAAAFKHCVLEAENFFFKSLLKTEPDWAALEQEAKRLGLGA